MVSYFLFRFTAMDSPAENLGEAPIPLVVFCLMAVFWKFRFNAMKKSYCLF